MTRLIYFECKKHYFKLPIFISILILSIINLIQIHNIYRQNSLLSPEYSDASWDQLYWELYQNFAGPITTEKIENLMEIYSPLEKKTADLTASRRIDNPDTYTGNVYSDQLFLKWCFLQPMEYRYHYQEYGKEVVRAAIENMELYKSLDNHYEYRKNISIANLFNGRQIGDFSYTELYQFYLHYDFSVILLLFIILYGLIGVFVSEKESGMNLVLSTVKCGGFATVAAKLFSAALFTVAVSLWFLILDFLGFWIAFGTLEGSNAPLYAVNNFANASVSINLWQYSALSAIVKLLGLWVISLLFLCISRFFQNTLLPFLFGCVATIILFYVNFLFQDSSCVWAKILNPFTLLVCRELFGKTEYVCLFGFPVLSYIAAIAAALLWIGILTLLLFISHRKSVVSNKRRGFCAIISD